MGSVEYARRKREEFYEGRSVVLGIWGSVEYARRKIEEFYEGGSAVLGIWEV